MKKYGLDTFQLSPNYLFFWDKIEKANHFLDQIWETRDEAWTNRVFQSLVDQPIVDGAQWHMAISLVEKYGLVPATAYPETYSSADSGALNSIINSKLRSCAMKIREMKTADVEEVEKEKYLTLRKIYEILLVGLGAPPNPYQPFTWEFYDKQGVFRSVEVSSPLEFAMEFFARPTDLLSSEALPAVPLSDMYSLVNDPRHSCRELLTIPRRGNVVGGRSIRHINVEMKLLKQASIQMIRNNMPVFMACDARQSIDVETGVLDLSVYDIGLGFNVEVPCLDKKTRLQTRDSRPTHVMVITAVHTDKNDEPIRWRCQNSWGKNVGSNGFFVMSDRWMDEYVTQVVVHPGVLPSEIGGVLEKRPIELELWDPMGSVA